MSALYVYAVAPGTLDASEAHPPPGVAGARVTVERGGPLAALVSPLDGTDCDPSAIDERSRDVEWLGARAAEHDRVITWASDRGAVVPLPLFSLFRDAAGVRAMLERRGAELQRMLDAVAGAHEYTVRVYRIDAELAAVVAAHSPELAELARRVAAATPGQRYLLDRKLEQVRRTEIDRVADEVASTVFEKLSALARRAERDPIGGPGDAGVATGSAGGEAQGRAVLNASFLVDTRATDAFRAVLTQARQRHGAGTADSGSAGRGGGFRFEFTGPWPPYHFVRGSAGTVEPPGPSPAPEGTAAGARARP